MNALLLLFVKRKREDMKNAILEIKKIKIAGTQ